MMGKEEDLEKMVRRVISEKVVKDEFATAIKKTISEVREMERAAAEKITGKQRRKMLDYQINVPTLLSILVFAVVIGTYKERVDTNKERGDTNRADIRENKTNINRNGNEIDSLRRAKRVSVPTEIKTVTF